METINTGDHPKTVLRRPASSSTASQVKTIRTTHRTERSLLTYILHLVLKLFLVKHLLGRYWKLYEPGSVPLMPPDAIKKHCSITNRHDKATGVYIADLRPLHTPAAQVKKHIYYFCGGSWQSPATSAHWETCLKLVQNMPETIISIVSYPLAPHDPAPKTFPLILALYRDLMAQAAENGERVILAGDSAGGNVVLAVVLEALREDFKGAGAATQRPPCPVAVMAISASVNLNRDNPDIQEVKKYDPLLTPRFINQSARAWAGDWDVSDPRLSPINADLSLLQRAGIKVHGIIGGYDILGPDQKLFRDACAAAGVYGEWLDWDKQMHDFLLTWKIGCSEGKEAMDWMANVLNEA